MIAGFNSTDFRYFHKQHHTHTNRKFAIPNPSCEGVINSRFDPELPGANGGLRNYLFKLFGGEMGVALYFMFKIALLGEKACDAPWTPAHARHTVASSMRLQAGVYVVLVAYWLCTEVEAQTNQCALDAAGASTFFQHSGSGSWVLWYWLLPLLIGQPFLWGQFIAQHTGTEERPQDGGDTVVHEGMYSRNMVPCHPGLLNENGKHSENSNLSVRDWLEVYWQWLWYISSCWHCLLSWNMPYHAVHHMYPTVPFHQLPHAFALLEARTVAAAPSGTTTTDNHSCGSTAKASSAEKPASVSTTDMPPRLMKFNEKRGFFFLHCCIVRNMLGAGAGGGAGKYE